MYYRRINGVNRYFLTLEAANNAAGVEIKAERQTPVKTDKNGKAAKSAKTGKSKTKKK